MTGRYLTDLAEVCRTAGLDVVEYPSWRTRARSSGGYSTGRPTHVMVHHTASPPSWSGKRDADYCAVQDSDAPLSNLCLDRDGVVWILAAGATNTNGKGSDWWGGGVPENSMNSYAVGIEANGGYGSSWPTVQTDSYLVLVDALCRAYSIPNNNVRGHFEWAPTRKIDPAGVSPWATANVSWNMDSFRSSCSGARPLPPDEGGTDTVPPPALDLGAIHDEGETMFVTSKDGTFWLGNGLGRRKLKDTDEVDFLIDKFGRAGTPLVNFQGGQKVSDRTQINSTQQLNRLGVDLST